MSFENVVKFEYLEIRVIGHAYIHKLISE